MRPAAVLVAALLAACGPSKEDLARKAAFKEVAGSYELDVERTAQDLPADQRKNFLKANRDKPPRYELREDGSWTMRVTLGASEVVREGRLDFKKGKYVLTPTKVDAAEAPGASFELVRERGRWIWAEEGRSYLKKKKGVRS